MTNEKTMQSWISMAVDLADEYMQCTIGKPEIIFSLKCDLTIIEIPVSILNNEAILSYIHLIDKYTKEIPLSIRNKLTYRLCILR